MIQPLDIWRKFEKKSIHFSIYKNAKEFEQARILLIFCVAAGALCLLTIILGALSKPEFLLSYILVALGHVLTCSTFLLLRVCQSMKIPSRAMLFTVIFQLGQAPIWTGFDQSPVLYTYPLATIFVGIIGGPTHAFISGGLLSLIALSHWYYGQFIVDFAAGVQLPWISIMVLIWCTVTAMALVVYNHQKEQHVLLLLQNELEHRIQAQESSEASNQAKDVFMAYLSHEVRNPLTTIVATVDMLQNHSDPVTQQKYVQVLQSASGSLSLVLDDVLDFSALHRSQLDLKPVVFDWVELLQELYVEYENQVHLKDLAFTLKLPKDLSASDKLIYADRLRIRQILINLLSNAIKFTHQGEIQLMANKKDEKIQFSIVDTGLGIEAQLLQHIFEPFARARNYQVTGIGLGLAICKGILELMGSEIHVNSTFGFGSHFFFEIPIFRSSLQNLQSSEKKGKIEKNV